MKRHILSEEHGHRPDPFPSMISDFCHNTVEVPSLRCGGSRGVDRKILSTGLQIDEYSDT